MLVMMLLVTVPMMMLMMLMMLMISMYDLAQDNGALAEPRVGQYSQGIQARHSGHHPYLRHQHPHHHHHYVHDIFSDDDRVKGPSFNPELGVQIHALQKGIFDAHICI